MSVQELYHYTSCEHLKEILNDKTIKLTASNLLRPLNPTLRNGVLADVTDSYKPVVWFTSLLDFKKAIQAGLTIRKTEVAIMFDALPLQTVHKWTEWAERNNIEREWFDRLKVSAPLYDTFYITECPIKITERTKIIFRPDIKRFISK